MKKGIAKRLFAILLALVMALALYPAGELQAATKRKADVTKASSGNELLGVQGDYEYVAKATILKRINEIRQEACKNGYINPSTGEKLKSSDYVPMVWSSDLEWIAQLRAAEATVNEDHTRPNGKDCFSITKNDNQSWAENLAWNNSGLMQGIEQWYGEKADWVNQNQSAVTGHYTSMINPAYVCIGLGSFRRSSGGWYGVAAEFGYEKPADESQTKLSGTYIQLMEISSDYTGGVKLQGASTIKKGSKKLFRVIKTISYPGIMGGANETTGFSQSKVTWSSSNTSVATVDSVGRVQAKKAGKTVIKAKVGKKTLKKTVTVK